MIHVSSCGDVGGVFIVSRETILVPHNNISPHKPHSLSGHKSAVTCLKFDASGTRLISGSKDTNLIVWDLVSQTGLFR